MGILTLLLKIVLGLVVVLVLLVVGVVLTALAKAPRTVFDLAAPAAATPPAGRDARPVLVFGASGDTGSEVTRLLRLRGLPVTAAVRATSDRSRLTELGAQFVVADVLDAGAVQAAVGSADYQAVISIVGCLRCDPHPDFTGNRNIIDSVKAAGIHRMILVTTIGAGDSLEATNLLTRVVLRPVLPLKTMAEDHLKASGLDYTIIRPGGLRPAGRPPTGHGQLTEDRQAFGYIARTDLAELIVGALEDDRTVGHTFAAVDPGVRLPWR
ncbi:MAG: SDR family oxidoreductase [Gammaproteobacteria bacterium PRO9]|nr:SDR family oxidoreductase [Gammaproteobacteria bacterium PRO9]